MKNRILQIALSVFFLAIITSCGKDNFDVPESYLTGVVTYEGTPICLASGNNTVQLQIYQNGYDKYVPISVFVGQDGSFSANLFDGEYKLVAINGNGPWRSTADTLYVKLNGRTHVNYEVIPYFMMYNIEIDILSSGIELITSFLIEQIVGDAEISSVILLISNTQFVDEINNIYRREFIDINTPGQYDIRVNLTGIESIKSANALFGRISVKAEGADQPIYSDVIRLK